MAPEYTEVTSGYIWKIQLKKHNDKMTIEIENITQLDKLVT